MFAWEKLFLDKVRKDREKELFALTKSNYFKIVIVFFWYSIPLLVSMVTFTTFVLLGHELTPALLFRSLGMKTTSFPL
jgi:ATP-binding cassette subfamily C (CFTR/MRP) protein 10